MVGLVIIGLWLFGAYLAWNNFTYRTGLIGKVLPKDFFLKLNSGTTGYTATKAVLSLIAGFVIFAIWFITILVRLAFNAADGKFGL